jgi:predicted nucleic acid-binding Zn ribbon protein
MNYLFSCKKCSKKEYRDIPMKEYNKEKNNQICTCGVKMERVIEWAGIAEGKGEGWYGKAGGNVI